MKWQFRTPFHNPDHQSDSLYSDDWKDAIAYGAFEGYKLIGAIETCPEWNRRLRVTEMWVDSRHRRKGVGSALMEYESKSQGKRADARLCWKRSRAMRAQSRFISPKATQ